MVGLLLLIDHLGSDRGGGALDALACLFTLARRPDSLLVESSGRLQVDDVGKPTL